MEKAKNKKLVVIIVIAVVVCVLAAAIVIFVLNKGHRLIVAESYDGNVILTRGDEEQDIVDDMHLKSNDKVNVCENSLLQLLIDEDKHVIAEAETEFEIVATGNPDKGMIDINLLSGSTKVVIDNKLSDESFFNVTTPNATLSVRGTTFTADYVPEAGVTKVSVDEGVVAVSAGDEEREVVAGETVVIGDGKISTPQYIDISYEIGYHVYSEEYLYNVNWTNFSVRLREKRRRDIINDYWTTGEEYSGISESLLWGKSEQADGQYEWHGKNSDINGDIFMGVYNEKIGPYNRDLNAYFINEMKAPYAKKLDDYSMIAEVDSITLTNGAGESFEIPLMDAYLKLQGALDNNGQEIFVPLYIDNPEAYPCELQVIFEIDPLYTNQVLEIMNIELKEDK